MREVLARVPEFAIVQVQGTVCFTSSDWGFLNLGRPFRIDGVLVAYPGAVRDAILAPMLLNPDAVGRIAAKLATTLKPA